MKGVITSLLLSLSLSVLGWSETWTLVKDKNEVQVYTREVAGSEYLEFKGVTRVKGSVASVVAILYDMPNAPKWLDSCSMGMTVEEVSFEENYVFENIDLTFPVSDRKVTLHSQLRWEGDSAYLSVKDANTFCQNKQTKRCAKVMADSALAVDYAKGLYSIQAISKTQTQITWVNHTQPGGSVPTWLVNMMVVSLPYNSLLAMQSMVVEEKYKAMSREQLQEQWRRQFKKHHKLLILKP